MEEELYILCSDDNMILEHIDYTNKFKLKFDVKESYSNIVDLIKSQDFYTLIKELNSDIVRNVEIIGQNDYDEVVFDIEVPNSLKVSDTINKNLKLHLFYKNTYGDLQTKIEGFIPSLEYINTKKMEIINDIYLENTSIIVYKKGETSTFELFLNFDNKINDKINKFLALYLKKLFKKVKMYFDN
jgi:hypothetical protein